MNFSQGREHSVQTPSQRTIYDDEKTFKNNFSATMRRNVITVDWIFKCSEWCERMAPCLSVAEVSFS